MQALIEERRCLWIRLEARPPDRPDTRDRPRPLPRADALSTRDARQAPDEQAARLSFSLAGLWVLVVDDDTDTRDLFAAVLATGGANVATAGSAQEALAAIATRPVDVVLSDIAMPGGDGYWLVRQIRALPDTAVNAVPVVAVTAFGREHSPARVLAAGFTAHLQKPTDPDLLCRTVAAAAGR